MNNKTKGKGKFKKNASNASGRGARSSGAKDTYNKANYKGSESRAYDEMCTNDISWYNKMPNLFNRATQVPFNRILGDNMSDPEFGVQSYTSDNYHFRRSLPLVMRIGYVPGIGVCDDYNDAPNRAFQAMYSALLTKTSTSTLPFTAANLALYTICAQSIAQNIGVAKRMLETAKVYTPDNFGLPRAYIAAQIGANRGAEPIQDILDHIGEYEWSLNNVIRDFNSLRIPNFIDTFKRHYLLSHSYFMDNDTVGSQAYVFVPESYYIFNDLGKETSENKYDGIARAESKDWIVHNFPMLLDIIKEQIGKLRSSKDFTSINGTLKRAFDESDFVRIDEMVGNETPNFLVDPAVTYQIHNMTMCKIFPDNDNDMVADYTRDIVVYNPYVTPTHHLSAARSFLLNTFEDSVDADWIMEATRLITAVNDDHTVYTCGTEIITSCSIYYVEYDAKGKATGIAAVGINDELFDLNEVKNQVVSDLDNWPEYVLPMLEKFHKGPRFAFFGKVEVPDPTSDLGFSEKNCVVALTGDLHFYTFASRDTIKRLHDTALLSIFDTTAAMAVQ